jgi:hypothetical protein
VTILACSILIPVYYYEGNHKTQLSNFYQKECIFLMISLADSLTETSVLWFVLVYTFLFTVLSYYMLFQLCQQMSQFEFQPNEFTDYFIAAHSVIIRGVSKDIGSSEAQSLIS